MILLHTSKTMRPPGEGGPALTRPMFANKAAELAGYLKTLPAERLSAAMKLSPKLAVGTATLVESWTDTPSHQRAAIDSFLGDIYSGLQVQAWSEQDRVYAAGHLRIVSGLYGLLRPDDGIHPYRLEMGYRLPDEPYRNLYSYWGTALAEGLPDMDTVVDLTAAEYGKAVLPHLADTVRVVSPKFLTRSPKTGEPVFVVVHAKIARGAFASWMVRNRISAAADLTAFAELGYTYDGSLSTLEVPVFVCREFGGIGLSVRLT